MFKDATTMIRDYIAEHPGEWDEIIHNEEFMRYFTVKGNSLKNVPKGYDKEHSQAEFLKYKSWYLEYAVEDNAILSPETFLQQAAQVYTAMKPFNDYLNRALSEFQMPVRG